jgi:uncharacterized membrane protein YbaN (DUF454 family)
MYLYLIGAWLLQVTLLSAMMAQWEQHGTVSTAMGLYVFLFTWFIVEVLVWLIDSSSIVATVSPNAGQYIYHEHVHLYTYDIFAEKYRWLTSL